MKFTTRLVLLVTVLTVGATLVTAALLTWTTRRAIITEAEASGEKVARLLARSASLAASIPTEVEGIIAEEMAAEGTLLAHFVEAAERAGMTTTEINRRLKSITDQTTLDEIWITDDKGHAYLHSLPDVDFTFSNSPQLQPQAYAFYDLLTGNKKVVDQDARKRDIDNQHFKYVGVGGIDKPRIIQVGRSAKFLQQLTMKIGLPRTVENLLADGDIDAVWVFDRKLDALVGPGVYGADSRDGPNAKELGPVRLVIADGQTRHVESRQNLSVIAPVRNDQKEIVGAALVRLPMNRVWATVQSQAEIAAVTASAIAALGILLSIGVARYQSAPLRQITRAAAALESQKFDPALLAPVSERRDELGQLARVFTGMAGQVAAREEYLDSMVKQRTEELETRNRSLEGLSAALSKYLSPQVYSSIFSGHQGAEIASKRKKLTIFLSDIANFTATTDKLESEDLTAMLNRYLAEMAQIALKHGATIDKYVGDAVLAFFGDPESRGVKEDAVACVMMAIEMQDKLKQLEMEWIDAGAERPFRVRIGINTGFCTVGNFGSPDRMDYTIVGGAVNLTSRLEQNCEPGSILISHVTWSLVNDLIDAEERPALTVKGFAEPVRAYEVRGLKAAASTAVIRKELPGMRLFIDTGAADRTEVKQTLAQVVEDLDRT
ncbi:adenylate/guanylate cyclase [Rhodopseudomonas thermotolerans]|jgi:class 3 adenylate cyclase/HAMP domain-containing protein|uniref:Adenylate/guanylate cyclase n=2 Tax=Rhodopseudomonas TaxID=1073 RepID=A0A336JT42_9BRAD|nr:MULTISPECIES: adenylate/guanylate cyclase domain-containing protein [Rhodopseudomonas]RED27291.1 adenylate/guanylate cyclase [Rhodopseudomonas pentothenatexigens]REF91100.1 adenylate/guanylate cyclase [Rhodopseudomonas thermotolerans]SSW92947.1 adenylate/guanylate cyclase [Rhodopseudomonas pentothenatexigens]